MRDSKWRVLIADDEPAARLGVRQRLAAYTEFTIVGECRDGRQVLSALEELNPDVVFLDLQMPGLDGFEVIRRRTPERMPVVVILTAYSQFALRAFDAQALDYLVKPTTEARFATTMRRVSAQLRGGAAPRPAPLIVTTARGAVLVPVHEIDWIEASGNYARIWTARRSYLLRSPLRVLERRVGTDGADGFLRAHRRALVRVHAIRELVWSGESNLTAVLSTGQRIPISRRRRAAFMLAVRRFGDPSSSPAPPQ